MEGETMTTEITKQIIEVLAAIAMVGLPGLMIWQRGTRIKED